MVEICYTGKESGHRRPGFDITLERAVFLKALQVKSV
jgi:hypothetical protein